MVSRVRTKNMKMTNTARPTQKPITMESGTGREREVRNNKRDTLVKRLCFCPTLIVSLSEDLVSK